MEWDGLLRWVGIAGAIGTAAMGLVEACKVIALPWGGRSVSIATIGLRKTLHHLGPPVIAALRSVYGEGGDTVVLEGAWRNGPEEMEKVVRDGLRLAIFNTIGNLNDFVQRFGETQPQGLLDAVNLLKNPPVDPAPTATQLADARARLARFESVVDVRVKAAVAAGRDAYVSANQAIASVVAIASALAAVMTGILPSKDGTDYAKAIAVGILAVPIAPVAKDVATFLNSVRNAFSAKKPVAP